MHELSFPTESELKRTYRLPSHTAVYRNLLIRRYRREGMSVVEILKKFPVVGDRPRLYRIFNSPVYDLIERDFPEAIDKLSEADL